ncbi:acetyl-coenzyme A synthetase N-terminal domain-containing protein, partial [Haloferax volcanii]
MAEDEEIPPSPQFVEQATVTDDSVSDEFEENWPDCWARAAATLDWFDPYESVLPDDEPPFEWFAGGTLNACYNCVDRHVEAGAKNRVAIKWESHLGETRTYTYQDLYREVNEF